jgi:hypothetical protein
LPLNRNSPQDPKNIINIFNQNTLVHIIYLISVGNITAAGLVFITAAAYTVDTGERMKMFDVSGSL